MVYNFKKSEWNNAAELHVFCGYFECTYPSHKRIGAHFSDDLLLKILFKSIIIFVALT